VVGQLLRDLGESDTSRDTATLSQRKPRSLVSLVGGCDLPQAGGRRGERKRRRTWKYRRDLGEGKITGLNRKIRSDGSSPHRAWGGKRPVLGGQSAR
jgi:hypothetical protein